MSRSNLAASNLAKLRAKQACLTGLIYTIGILITALSIVVIPLIFLIEIVALTSGVQN